jgi:hypothetical protein
MIRILVLIVAIATPGEPLAGTLTVTSPPNTAGSITLHAWNAPDTAVPVARLQVPGKSDVPDGIYGLSVGDFQFRHGPITVTGEVTIDLAALTVHVPEGAVTTAVTIHDGASGQLVAALQPPGLTVLPSGRFIVRRDGAETVSTATLGPGTDRIENWGALRFPGPPLAVVFALRSTTETTRNASDPQGEVEQRIDKTTQPFALPAGHYRLLAAANARPHAVEILPGRIADVRATLLNIIDMSTEAQPQPLRLADPASGASLAWWDKGMPDGLALLGHAGALAIERGGVALGTATPRADGRATIWIVPSGRLAVQGDAEAIPVAFVRDEPIVPGKPVRLAYAMPSATSAKFALVPDAAGEAVSLGDARLGRGRGEIDLVVPAFTKHGAYRIALTATLPTGEQLAGRSAIRAVHRRIESAPVGLRVLNATATNLGLAWTAHDPPHDIAGYNLYRNASSRPVNGRALIVGTTYEDNGLGAGRAFAYRVCPVDSLGLEGPCSDEVNGTTARQ